MTLSGEQVLLRVYLHSADRAPHTPTYERILKAAREQGLAGATVIKGIMGSGQAGVIQQSGSMWTVVEHVPVIVEIVDNAQAIGRFIESSLAQLLIHGMATLERAHVLVYRHSQSPPTPPLRVAGPVSPLSTLPLLQARSRMAINEDGVLLRVMIGESDRWQHRPLYQAIVEKVRQLGLAGATVLRGVAGFGAHSVMHKAALVELSADMPVVIEIVDEADKIERVLPELQAMVGEGLITMEHVAILRQRGT